MGWILATWSSKFLARHHLEWVYFVIISPKYTFLTIHLHKWNKISVTCFEYRHTLQMFLHTLKKIGMF